MIYNNVILNVKDADDIPKVCELLAEMARLSSAEPGCVRFDIHQSEADEAFFLLVEEWESQKALDAHRDAPAFADFYVPRVIPLVERAPHPSRRIWPPEV